MKKITLLTLTTFGLAISACTPTNTQHGNILKDEQIAAIKPGQHLRSDVLNLLGSPTTQAPFDNNLWYYMGQHKEKRGIMDREVVDERIVAVRFDEKGMVQSVVDLDTQRVNVPVSDESTPTHGNDVTILQQFLGNIGKFNPAEE